MESSTGALRMSRPAWANEGVLNDSTIGSTSWAERFFGIGLYMRRSLTQATCGGGSAMCMDRSTESSHGRAQPQLHTELLPLVLGSSATHITLLCATGGPRYD